MLIEQHPKAQAAKLLHPGRCAAVELVVTQHQRNTFAGLQLLQRGYMRPQGRNVAIDHITRDGHQVSLQGVDFLHDALHITAANSGADVNVRNLHDAKSVQTFGQPVNWNIDMHHARCHAGQRKADHCGRK